MQVVCMNGPTNVFMSVWGGAIRADGAKSSTAESSGTKSGKNKKTQRQKRRKGGGSKKVNKRGKKGKKKRGKTKKDKRRKKKNGGKKTPMKERGQRVVAALSLPTSRENDNEGNDPKDILLKHRSLHSFKHTHTQVRLRARAWTRSSQQAAGLDPLAASKLPLF